MDSIKQIGKEITDSFLSQIKDFKLNEEEQGIISRASERLAASAILSPGATNELKADLVIHRDLALAAIENIAVAKVVQAEQLIRQTALNVVMTAVKIAISAAAS